MQIPIGETAFSAARNREHTVAVDEIRQRGWRHATQASHARLDLSLGAAAAAADEQPACRAGCWYCCYFKVEVRADEAFAIVEYVREHFTPERSKELREAVNSNARLMRQATPTEQLAANLKCPFLAGGTCSIYEVRPARCRSFHAVDVQGCQETFEQPQNLNIVNSFVPEIFKAGEAYLDAYQTAMRKNGLDTTIYEMNTALADCLTDSGPIRRFEKGKPAFGTRPTR
ncbi:MAG: YkgJ family cysteine cluster protein [Steroidobacteraceae bacterium]